MDKIKKELLLKDLSARLFYGVKFQGEDSNVYTLDSANYFALQVQDVVFKPYLRPMSSMTEEERSELRIIWHEDFAGDSSLSPENLGIAAIYSCHPKTTDFYLSHHFDYRGLIEKGLALEAPEGMYE